ncbi:unnamed protein product [Brachionus calyciflorus]|uniref:Peptidase S1 domain-containing protein n=1 Tax=Brachionus calyciflorus TaxID=104777 RepID=A0A814CP29_9BILA|nr:unnamed protein product [Brachionus calyciflorus]
MFTVNENFENFSNLNNNNNNNVTNQRTNANNSSIIETNSIRPGIYNSKNFFNKILDSNHGKSKKKFCISLIVILVLIVILITLVIVIIVIFSSKNNSSTSSIKTTTSSTSKDPLITNIISTNNNSIPFFTPSNSACSYGYIVPYCDECGLAFVNPNVKIVGGKEAEANSWPSLVSIKFNYKFYVTIQNNVYEFKQSSSCGGTLINRKTVLTAGHCFLTEVTYSYDGRTYFYTVVPNELYPTFESMYTVYIGLHSTSDTSGVVISEISKFLRYPYYDEFNTLNDISIITLAKEVEFTNKIQPSCLPDSSIQNYPTKSNIDSWAVGWGALYENGPISPKLQNVRLTIYNSSMCSLVGEGSRKNWNTQICAGEYLGGKDTCQGDSGGPLFVKDYVNGVLKYILVGITSYGNGCGNYRYPGIYTKVSAYLSWIKQNME